MIRFARFRLEPWQALLVLLGGLALPALGQPVAVLLSSAPGATVVRGGDMAKAVLLHRLQPGDELRVPAQGQVVMLYMKGGDEYLLKGPAAARIEGMAPAAISGDPAEKINLKRTHGTRVLPERVAQGGVVMRSVPPPEASPSPEQIAARRPAPGASTYDLIRYGLWLEEVGAAVQAKAWWRALAAERPDEPELAARAR